MTSHIFWIIALSLFVGTLGQYENCEVPPTVSYATVRMEDDDDNVRAIYACNSGYILEGETELICDLNTDKWDKNPPTCVKIQSEDDADENDEANDINESSNSQTSGQGRKKKTQDIPEDPFITADFAEKLDMSCVSARIKAPEIPNGFVQKYDRRRKGESTFITAFYSCNDNFELEDSEQNMVYCSKRKWLGELPKCIALNDYNEEDYEEYDEGGEDEDDDEVPEEDVKKHPPKNPETTVTEPEIEYTVKVSGEVQDEVSTTTTTTTTTAAPEVTAVTDVNIVVQPTVDPYTPRVLNQSCGPDKGGCDHNCEMVLYPGENEPRVVCTCYSGFTLDPYNYRGCHDIDECSINNGGCEQTCKNIPGSFECTCQEGLQIDTATGKTCIDINECESSDIASKCPGGCENTPGSYNCLPKPTEETRSNEVVTVPTPTHTLLCEEGFRLSPDGNCVDIDECTEGIAKCDNCRNNHGSFDCLCPPGYELADDERTCVDINECEAYTEDEGNTSICSHECENTQGSFICKCKELFHLSDDRRTCVKDSCQDMGTNKTQCSHYCEDTADGPLCKCPDGFDLAADKSTCVEKNTTDACQELGGNERCFPGSCASSGDGNYKCSCPGGFRDEVYFCKDIDECTENTHNCSHICFNTDGSFVCQCPIGFQTMEGSPNNCVDIDECQEKDGVCGDRVCKNVDGGFNCVCPDGSEPDTNNKCPEADLCSANSGGCSHSCSSFDGRVSCQCPSEMKLSEDGFTCVHLDPCANNNNGCSQICNSLLQGICSCEPGFELQEDGKNCRDIDECIENNGGCEHICVNKIGGYECLCKKGYGPGEGNRCFDIDECALDTHNCAMGLLCENVNGSYACQCPRGLAFTGASSTECSDIDECSLNNGNCSDFCINLHGSFQCSCPSGKVLTDDERTCDYVDGCLIDNGGCSHTCVYNRPHTTCACPYGYALESVGGKVCKDVDECAMGMAKCSHQCVNTVGSFVCACSEGYQLDENQRDCLDMDECVNNNGNCSNICINLLGSFSCACDPGFELRDDLRTCTDVDECSQALHDCSHYCVNKIGSYDCSCPAGFVLGPNKRTCIDVDECLGFSSCSHSCRNTLGSFECECPPGMILDNDKKTCLDGDFCSRLRPQCSHHCKNLDDGFECACPQGFKIGSDSLTCVDINECLIGNGECSHTCTNLEGSYSCLCPVGYKLGEDGKACHDINECEIDNGRCAHYCINSRGSHSCECTQGFALQADRKSCRESDPCRHNNGGCEQICLADGKCACRSGYSVNPSNSSLCSDIDECQVDNPCPRQNCRNTQGSYECFCEQGYTKDAYGHCIDINECDYQNAGCPGECVNLPGSYECKCPRGLRPSDDKKTCVRVRDQCQPFRPPKYGEIHCTRSRHRTHLYYKTKCSVWCIPGYQLEGPAVRHCSGNGQWDNFENRCVPQMCPRLPRAEHGVILPANCLLGKTYVGERCLLHCNPGYMPIGRKVNICNVDQSWSFNSTFDCIPIGTPIFNAPHERIDTNGLYGLPVQRPFIKCPRNTTVLLPVGHKTAHIILEKPKTNMDYRNVKSFPAWSRNLQAHLGAGVHVITFRGHDPHTRRGALCRTVITVKNSQPPRVTFCPPSFEVTLASAQEKRSIVWKEPEFDNLSRIKNIQKSNIPGQLFSEGVHRISYEATDEDGLTARCEFNVVVKVPQMQSMPYTFGYRPQVAERSSKLLAGHDSYIICHGQSPVKIYGTQPINLPPGCVIRNVRVNPVRHHHERYLSRRLITQRWTPFSNF